MLFTLLIIRNVYGSLIFSLVLIMILYILIFLLLLFVFHGWCLSLSHGLLINLLLFMYFFFFMSKICQVWLKSITFNYFRSSCDSSQIQSEQIFYNLFVKASNWQTQLSQSNSFSIFSDEADVFQKILWKIAFLTEFPHAIAWKKTKTTLAVRQQSLATQDIIRLNCVW